MKIVGIYDSTNRLIAKDANSNLNKRQITTLTFYDLAIWKYQRRGNTLRC